MHRLDRDASGLVLFAKDAAAHRDLCLLFEGRRIGKLYQAWVQGQVACDGAVERPLREYGSGRSGVCPPGSGKPALTRYRVRSRSAQASLLEVAPETGRRPQIRVHLHSLGHPVLGDRLYGHADQSLYEAKRGGRNRVEVYGISTGASALLPL